MNSSDTARPLLDRLQRNGLICGVIGIIVIAILALRDTQQFFRSYLFAFEFWLAIPLGSVAILMLHHLTGGWWGLPIRRILEAGSRTVRLMAVLFIPIVVGISKLYIWSNADMVQADKVLQDKHWWLNTHGIYRAKRDLFRRLASAFRLTEQMVSRAGPDGRPRAFEPHGDTQRAWFGVVGLFGERGRD